MIFKPVSNLTREEKAFFIEKVGVYSRLLELHAKSKGASFAMDKTIDKSVLDELMNIGVISTDEEVYALRKVLGEDKYKDFISAVVYFLDNKEEAEPIVFRLRNKSRKVLQEASEQRSAINVADFFCGAGGLSLGFSKAGYRIVFANDFQKICTETYIYNHPEIPSSKVFTGDIKDIIVDIKDYVKDDVDMVIGGPPCQSFSSANQRRVIDDPRNILYKYYIEAVRQLCPKFVLMENVKGMLKVANEVVEDYHNIRAFMDGKEYRYNVSYRLFNSVNFGVAQSRERLIYLAVRDDIEKKNGITPESLFEEIEESCKGNTVFNLQSAIEFIKPLEAPRVKGQTEVNDERTGMKIDLNHYDSCGNEYLKSINDGKQMEFVFNHKARYCSDVNYEIFKRLGQGEDSTNPKIADIMPYSRRNGIFKDKYYKLIADRPCRTITAHLKMDCLSHIHPYQIRSITPREAARIQSFPDDYLFLGAYLKTYMEIGNAVPVLMAEQISKVIKKHFDKK